MRSETLKSHAFSLFVAISESPPLRVIKRNAIIKKAGKQIKRRLFPAEDPYGNWLKSDLLRRQRHYTTAQEPGLISFVTTVWNTPSKYLKELAETVRRQKGGTHFEWVILDNGSEAPDTIAYLQQLRREPFVCFLRVAQNLGIIGGMRVCLENATGKYIVPVDSDDLLSLDAVAILTSHMQRHGYPPLMYTDEDKLISGQRQDPYFKPAWDPVLLANACYIAHLCAIDREIALKVEAYSDRETNGSHDWDTFIRFLGAGHTPIHIPEMTYTWRVHPQSTAGGNMKSKSYIHSSQNRVLDRFLAAQKHPERFSLEASPLFSGTPDWWFRRLPRDPRPMAAILLGSDETKSARSLARLKETQSYPVQAYVRAEKSIPGLVKALQSLSPETTLVTLIDEDAEIERADWMWEALGLFELFADTVMVGGRITSRRGTILSAGAVLGFGDNGCESPDHGRNIRDPGYFASLWKQRSVGAVSAQLTVVDRSFLECFLSGEGGSSVSLSFLGAWLGARARAQEKRVVYSPFLHAICNERWEIPASDAERSAFLAKNGHLLPDYRTHSPHLSLRPKSKYQPLARESLRLQLAYLFGRVDA